MAKNKDFRKNLKGPDKFQTGVASGVEQLYANRVLIGLLLFVAVSVFGGVFGWQYLNKHKTQVRQSALGVIERSFSKEVEKADEQKEKINKQIAELNQKKDPKKKDAKAEKKKKALEEKLAKVKPDHSKSLAEFKDFYLKNAKKPEGWMAGLRSVGILVEQKKFSEAEKLLKEVLTFSKKSEFYQVYGRMVYINLLEEGGKIDEALAEIKELEKVITEGLKPKLLLAKGRLEMSKNKKSANKTFELLIKDHGSSPEAKKARSIKAVLLN